MGNSHGGKLPKLEGKVKLAANRFDEDEMHVLHKTWQDLADRSNGKGIDKDTFLQYFPLNGLLGERLFAQFDTKGTGFIDFEEFIIGLAVVCRGNSDEKVHFIFNMYDVSHDNTVSRQELTTLLNQIPKEMLKHEARDRGHTRDRSQSSQEGHGHDDHSLEPDGGASGYDEDFEDIDNYTNEDVVERAFQECDLTHEGRLTFPAFKMWLTRNPEVLEHIESILPYNGLKDLQPHSHKKDSLPHLRRISSKASMMARMGSSLLLGGREQRQHSLSELAGDIFNHSTRKLSLDRGHSDPSSATRGGRASTMHSQLSLSRHGDSPSLDSTSSHAGGPGGVFAGGGGGGGGGSVGGGPDMTRTSSFAQSDNNDTEETVRAYLWQAYEMTQNEGLKTQLHDLLASQGEEMPIHVSHKMDSMEVYKAVVAMEDYLWKKGKAFHLWSRRYYLISGNCMYYYASKDDVRPKGVIFLTGSIIESVKDDASALKGYHGFELLHQDLCTGEHHRHEKRVLYCRSEQQRDKWVSALQHAAHVVPIEDDYVLGKELGRGRFSVVCECVNKVTGQHAAVKIIDKATIEPEEKGLLRTEIAVLKLVNHPNIIRMEGLYETKKHLYIVMEMLKGGELFERIVGRPRFTELEAAKLLRPLLEAVAYLHDVGIVHRDLKPENILCGEELEDLKIADFGLSKMVLPKEKMDAACGTLSYVAPEVLTMQGYGKEADLWSVGVIMFLLLCGKLPFDGDDHNEIIRSTIQAELKVNSTVWNKLADDAKNLMMGLLNKNPKERTSARDALKHPFILHNAPHVRRNAHSADKMSGSGQAAQTQAQAQERVNERSERSSSAGSGAGSGAGAGGRDRRDTIPGVAAGADVGGGGGSGGGSGGGGAMSEKLTRTVTPIPTSGAMAPSTFSSAQSSRDASPLFPADDRRSREPKVVTAAAAVDTAPQSTSPGPRFGQGGLSSRS